MERDDPRKLPPDNVQKVRDLVSRLTAMENISEFFAIPGDRPHVLTGDRKGVHAISVSANRRLTFGYDDVENEVYDLNLEDYH